MAQRSPALMASPSLSGCVFGVLVAEDVEVLERLEAARLRGQRPIASKADEIGPEVFRLANIHLASARVDDHFRSTFSFF